MTFVIFDAEADGLLDTVTKVHSLQIGDADGSDAVVYADWPGCRPIPEGLERLKAATMVIGHNLLTYDLPLMERFYPGTIRLEQCFDTLIASRLNDPESRSHSLKTLGAALGVLKGEFTGPWDTLTQEMIDYAAQDVTVGRAIWHSLKHVRDWGHSCDLEHKVAHAIFRQEVNGFALDVSKAENLAAELREEQAKVAAELQAVFPPLERTVTFTPKANNKTRGYVKGVPFIKRRMEAFNPNSRAHVAERLMALGWKPQKFGEDGVPSVDEKVLGAMKHPLAKVLQRSFRIEKQLGMLADGKSGWLKLVGKDGRLHGRVNPNGTRTGRMTHSKPNVAQADKRDQRMRECFVPKAGWKLIGCDGEGIQLRILAHYLARYDGGQLAERLVSGDSSKRTDAHSANLKSLVQSKVLPQELWDEGFKAGREGAKTCIYAKLFGSSDAGLGHTAVEVCRKAGLPAPRIPFRELGRMVNVALARSMSGLDKLEADAGARVKSRGVLAGLDGRLIPITQARLALVTLCQAGEAVLMKQALADFFFTVAPSNGWVHGTDYGLCANIHDEVQIEARPEIIVSLGAAFAECIRQAGVTLGLRCQFAGKASSPGNSWAETH